MAQGEGSVTPKEIEEAREIIAVGRSKALSSGQLPALWQVPLSLLESAARRYTKGNEKSYPIHNWRSGLNDPIFIRDRANHAVTHMLRLVNGDHSVDDPQGNVDAVVWFCALVCEVLRTNPDVLEEAFYNEPRGEKLNASL